MFESIEIRRVSNGFIVALRLEDDEQEYVFDSSRRAMKFIKEYMEAKTGND